jgi:CheY-like chemotaxis protein
MPHRILVVEDDREIRDAVIDVLSDRGYEAFGAADGVEALAQLRDPSEDWCVVLLDLMLPNMDGREFRSHQLGDPSLAEIPVVIVSAMPNVEEVAAELDVAAHITKPVSLDKLVRTVEQFCPLAA